MKTITATRKTKPLSLTPYGDTVRIIDQATGLVQYTGNISTNPNPTAAAGKILWFKSYAQIAPGRYTWRFVSNHPKYGRCILVNEGKAVPTTNTNAKHQNRNIATEIFIHKGWKDTWRGSAGCFTVPPREAERFFSFFKEGETGTLILNDLTKSGTAALMPLLILGAAVIAGIYITKGRP